MNRLSLLPLRLGPLSLPLLGLLLPAGTGCDLLGDSEGAGGSPPYVEITSPQGDYLLVNAEVLVEGRARPGSVPITTVEYRVNDGPGRSVPGDADGNFDFTIEDLAEGANTITVTATDRNGNTASDAVNVYYDPDIQARDFLILPDRALVLPDGSLPGYFHYVDILVWRTPSLDGEVAFTARGLPDGVSATFSDGVGLHAYELVLESGVALASGSYPVTIHGTLGGLEREAPLTLAVGLEAPIVEIQAPASGTTVTSPSVGLEVWPTWHSFIDLDYRLDGGEWQNIAGALPNELNRFTVEGLQEGTNLIEVRARDFIDAALSGSASVSVTYTPGGGGGSEYDLSVDRLDVSPASVHVDEQVYVTIHIRKNPSNVPDPGIVVEAALPEGFTFVETTPSDADYDPATGRWRFTMTSVYATLQVIARADSAGTYTQRVAIIEGLGVGDVPSNNGAEVTFTVMP